MPSSISNFNSYFNQTERLLSEWAAIPIIGTPVAICKLALGTIQTITALALGVFTAPFRCCSKNVAAFNNHCWTHFIHGLGNMIASLAEAIPLIGTFLYANRMGGHHNNNPDHQDKYIPYADLIELDLEKTRGVAHRFALDTTAPTALSPTRFRAFIGVNVVSEPMLMY